MKSNRKNTPLVGTNLFNPKLPLDLTAKPLIGMVHLPPLIKPFGGSDTVKKILNFVIQEAITLEKAGFDAVLVENFHDIPYSKNRIDDTELLLMSLLVEKIISNINIPCGVNILRNACVQAVVLASVTGASFIRCNIYEGAYVTDQGIIESVAVDVQQKHHELQSRVKILADIHVKHATPLGKFTLVESAKNTLNRGAANAIIVSGRETGKLIDIVELKNFVQLSRIKPILGSGLTIKNLSEVFSSISGAIVGSSIKVTDISSPVDIEKAKSLAKEWKNQRELEKEG